MNQTAQSAYAAWNARRIAALRDIDAALAAPAFFKPEWTIRARAEFELANAWCTYWTTVGAA